MSMACHHPNGIIRVTYRIWKVESHIVGIVKPPTTDSDKLETNEDLVLDVRLLERVLT